MDYAKEGGFAQYKGSGDYAATTLRCTIHEGCWAGQGYEGDARFSAPCAQGLSYSLSSGPTCN